MNNKLFSIFENTLIVAGVSISLPMIESILGIIILSFQIILIMIKTIMKIKESIKNKNYQEIEEHVQNAQDEIEKLSGKDKHE